jgi:hypothetical protein
MKKLQPLIMSAIQAIKKESYYTALCLENTLTVCEDKSYDAPHTVIARLHQLWLRVMEMGSVPTISAALSLCMACQSMELSHWVWYMRTRVRLHQSHCMHMQVLIRVGDRVNRLIPRVARGLHGSEYDDMVRKMSAFSTLVAVTIDLVCAATISKKKSITPPPPTQRQVIFLFNTFAT